MRRWPVWVFLGWTVFVWAGRIRNGGSLLLALSFLVLAGLALWRRRPFLAVLAVWTIGVWAVRTPFALAPAPPVGSKVVHCVLAIGRIPLPLGPQRAVQRERQAPATPPRL